MPGRVHSGQRLGGYELAERLAIGGMAEIYAARDPETQQLVVLKVLLPQHARDAEFVQMLADEARLTAALDHPALVRTLDFVQPDEGTPFLVMEFIDGASLARLIEARAHAPLAPELALGIADRLLDALDYIHQRRDQEGQSLAIVHRDVTPANVLMGRDGSVKLGDFGIARSRMRRSHTRTGVVKGTVQYMSPEQVCGDDCDARSDIYGVGLILFELLTGKPYIAGEREVDLLRCAEEPPWRPPSRERQDLSSNFDTLLQPALAVFPEQRYLHARAMREALASCSKKLGVAPADAAAIAAWAHPLLPERVELAPAAEELTSGGPSAAGKWAAALLLAAGLGGGAYFVLQPGDAPRASIADARLRADASSPKSKVAAKDAAPAVDVARPDTMLASTDAPAPDVRRRPIRRVVRAKVPRRPRTRDAAPPAASGDEGAAARAYAGSYKALKQSLRARHLSEIDLDAARRRELRQLKPKPGAKAPSKERVERLARLQRELAALAIDRALVQRKLRRVDARLRTLAKDHADRARLEREATQALQAVMDGRLAQANKLLHRLEARLRKTP